MGAATLPPRQPSLCSAPRTFAGWNGRTDAAPEPDRRRVARGRDASAATSTRPTPTTSSASMRRPMRRRRSRPWRPPRRRSPAGGLRTPQQRADALDKIGTEILARKDELGRLLSREEGKTLPEGIGEAGRAGQIFKYFAGQALALAGELVPSVRPGHHGRGHPRAGGRGRADHALELPDRDPGLEDRAGAGLRQLRGVQARRPGAGLGLGAGRDHQPVRAAGRRVQPGDGPRLGGRRGADRHRRTWPPSASPARSTPAAPSRPSALPG